MPVIAFYGSAVTQQKQGQKTNIKIFFNMNDQKEDRKEVLERAMPIPELVLFSENYWPVVDLVEKYFGVQIDVDRRFRPLVFPRQVTCYLLWVFTDLKLREIADIVGFNGRQKHSNVVHAIKSIKGFCKVDSNIRQQIIELERIIEEGK